MRRYLAQLPFHDKPQANLQAAEDSPADSDVAVPGNDGERAEQLLANSQAVGVKTLSAIAKLAVRRLVEGGPSAWVSSKSLFNSQERQRLSESLAATTATADLLGRARIRERQRQALRRNDAERYAELPPATAIFDEPRSEVRPQAPAKAVDYFKRLQPTIGVDPQRYGPRMERHAFTLAVATEETLLARVKDLIRQGLETGKVGTKPQQIQDLLDQAGVSPANPQYAEMAFRTNMMDAYNAGGTEELQDPDVADTFPVWQYLGIDDERAGEDHKPHFGKYFPSSVSFVEVRDSIRVRPFNCLLPGNYVQGRAVGALRGHYSGQAIEVVTRSGKRLSLTANHPVFTEYGFVPAGKLQNGLKLVSYRGEVDGIAAGYNEHHKPALVEKVFSAFDALGAKRAAKASSLFDLHGDGEFIEGDIHVVWADVDLWSRRNTDVREMLKDDGFTADGVCQSLVPRGGSPCLDFNAVNHATPGGVSTGNLPDSFGRGNLGPLEDLGFGSAANANACILQPVFNDGPGDSKRVGDSLDRFPGLEEPGNEASIDAGPSEFCGIGMAAELDIGVLQPAGYSVALDSQLCSELFARFPGKIAFDVVCEVRRFHYDGPVYDLETTVGYYVANGVTGANGGIIISNCRCGSKPVDRWTWAKLKAGGARIAEGYADVDVSDRVQVKTRAAVDREIAGGGLEVYRGVTDPSYADAMRRGDPYSGTGDYGSGVYVATDRGTAESYAAGPEGEGQGAVVRGAIDRRAKVVSVEEIERLHYAAAQRGEISYSLDLGEFAKRLGYDAIRVRDKGYLNVVNPRILLVDSQS